MDTNIGLSSLTFIKIIANAAFRVINTTQNRKPICKNRAASVEYDYIFVFITVLICFRTWY